MSFYRSILTTIAAVIIASPLFAETNANTAIDTTKAKAIHVTDNSTPPANDVTNSSGSQPGTQTDESKININKATEKELIKVRGLNATKAKAIVKYRKQHGNFKSLDTLAKIKGFKKLKADDLKSIEDQLSIE